MPKPPSTPSRRPAIIAALLGILALSCLVPRPAVAQTCVDISDIESTLPNSDAMVCYVADDWALKPSALTVGDRFRLMLMTSNGRGNDRNTNIATYNNFVRDTITNNGHAAIRAYASEFRAVVSTSSPNAVTARDNTHTSLAGGALVNDGVGVPIYWLGGGNEKLADNNFPGLWFNGSSGWARTGGSQVGRDENGVRRPADTRVWTGTRKDGTGFNGRRFGDFSVEIGLPDRQGREVEFGSDSDGPFGFYALSPIFDINTGISLDASTPAPESSYQYPIDVAIAPLVLPSATGGTGTLSYALTGTLPTGLAFDTATRTLSGTPNTATTASASLTYTITASESPITLALTFTVDVKAAGITWTGGNFVETADNDGAVMGELVGTLVGGIFAQAPGNPMMFPPGSVTTDSGSQTTRGLQSVITRTSSTVITVIYTGNSDMHADSNDAFKGDGFTAPSISLRDSAFADGLTFAQVANALYDGITFDFNDPDPINFRDIEAQSYPTHAQVAFTLPEARGGTGPFTYALRPATLPAGLTFDPATRTITGTPFETTAADTFIYTATDATGTGATAFTITVTTGTPPLTNTPAAGTVTVTIDGDGTVAFGNTLTADPSGITDGNGIPTAADTFMYQWQQGPDTGADTDADYTDITDATASEYTILAVQGGRRLRVQVSFTDAAGFTETVTSDATTALPAAAAISDATGAPTVTGTTAAGSTLRAATTGITDTNGVPTAAAAFTWQWQQESGAGTGTYEDIPGATSSTFFLNESHIGLSIRVIVSFFDNAGYAESLTSTATAAVVANSASNGVASSSNPIITGPFRVGLLANVNFVTTSISEFDGGENDGQYRWEQGPTSGAETPLEVIPGETFSNLFLTADQQGRRLRVTYFYFDGKGYLEEFTSALTEPIAAATPPGFVFTPTAVALNEGDTATYTVALASPLRDPDDINVTVNVEVAILTDNPLAVTVDPLFLTFTQYNFSNAQTVTVTAHQDANGIDETVTLTHTAPGEYGASAPLQVSVTDDEESELTLTTAALTLDEDATATYSVSLAAVPTGDAIVTIASDNPDVTTNPKTLDFTIANWMTPQEVTVTAADDTNASDDTATLTHTATGGYEAAVDLPVTVTDDDTATLNVENSSTSEANGGVTVRVGLDIEVTGGFTVDLTTMGGTATAPDDYTALTSHTLAFAGTAGETQSTFLTVHDNAIAENHETVILTLDNLNLRGTRATVDLSSTGTVTIQDNDIADPLAFDTGTIALPETEYTYITGTAIPTLTLPPATGGIPPLAYALTGDLPDGLTYAATARTLTGAPTADADAVTLTYTVTDGTTGTRARPTPLMRTFTVTINEALNFGASTIEAQAYIVDQTIPTLTLPNATGGVPPLTYTLTGTLPDGLTYTGGSDTTGGVLAGTPTAGAAATPLTYTATDSDASPNSVALTFMVSASTIPSVVSVTADAASIAASPLTTGETLDIVLTFSEAIVITDTPQLALNTGNSDDGVAGFSGVSTDGLAATFEYTVRAGDNTATLVYTGAGALTLPGGATIRNQADTQDAILTLPMPGAANSLSASATIVLDTAAPVFGITGTTAASPAQINVTLDTAANTVIHDAAATDDTALIYALGGTDATSFSLSTTGALSPVADLATENTYSIDITATDAAGNAATLYLSVVVADIPVLDITSDVGIDDTANIADIANLDNGRITFTAVWSEAVSGFAFEDILIVGGASNGVLSTVTEGLTYTFIAVPTGNTNDGVITITVAANTVTASGNSNIETIETQAYDTAAPSTPTITTPAANAIITATEATDGVPLAGGGVETGGSITLCLPGGSGTSCGSSGSGRTLRDVPVTGTDWAYTLNAADITAMGQGSETLNVIANDAAGNPSLPFTRTITVDTTAAPPTINAVSAGFINAAERTTGVEVTGSIGSDTLAITLCLNPVDAAVADCDGAGGRFTVTTIDTATTTWSRTLINAELTPFGEGVLTFTAIATDDSGNMAVSAAEMVTVDTVAPTAPTISTVATDDTINDAEQTTGVPISGTTDTATTVTLCFGGSDAACTGGSTSTATVTSTVWTYTLVTADYTAMGQGDETLRATAFDAAGNPSTETTLDIDIDTVLPVFPGTATTDTERRTIPAATGTDAGTTIYDAAATDNGVLTEMQDAGLTYALAGTNSAIFSLDTVTGELAPLSDLPATVTTYSVDITARDAAGNEATQYLTINVVDRPTVTIRDTVDTDTANRADGAITFTFGWSEAVTGFGAEASDITVDGGTVTGATAAASLVPVTAGLTYTLTVTPTDNTAGIITVTVEDGAVTANIGVDRTNTVTTAMQAYDTAAPGAPSIDAAMIAGDDTINDAEATATVTVTGGIGSDTTGITLCAGATSATELTCAGGNTFDATVDTTTSMWTYTLTDANITTIGEGTFTLTAIAADAVGNPAVSTGRDIIIDTVAPGAPTISEVSLDDIINRADSLNSFAGIFGTAEVYATVTLCFGGSGDAACPSGTSRDTTRLPLGSPSWSYRLLTADYSSIGQGVDRSLRAFATDAAGNQSPAGTRNITVDTVSPAAPTFNNMVAGDNIINDAEQRAGVPLSGTTETATTVTLCFGGTDATCSDGTTSTATVTGTVWTYTLDTAEINAMGQGGEILRAFATDSVGNRTSNTGNAPTDATHEITIDTVLPVFPGTATTATERRTINPATRTAVGMEIYDADAVDNGDFVAETADAGLTYALGGTNSAIFTLDTVTGELAPVSALPDSVTTYSIDITATDTAGNAATQYLTIAVSDIPTVGITNDAVGTIANLADGDLIFTFTWGEAVMDFVTGDITVTGGGTKGMFSGTNPGTVYTLVVTPTLNTAGTITVTVAADAATATTGMNRTNIVTTAMQPYDTQAPGDPEIGTVENDDIINAAERADLSGVILTGNTGIVGNDTTAVTVCIAGTDDACTGGTERDAVVVSTIWSYSLVDADFTAMGEGPQTVRITAFDAAGNPSTVVTRNFTIDTMAPAAPVITTPIAGDDRINAAEQTRGFAVAVTSSSSDTDTVTLCLGATDVTDTDCGGGMSFDATGGPTAWNTLLPANLSSLTDGALTFTAIATDTAGNPTVSSPGSVVTVDTTRPTFPGTATADDNRQRVTVATGAAADTTVHNAMATDNGRTADDGITYDLTGTHAATFAIDPATGVVTTASAIPDTVTTYNVNITATDEAGNVATHYLAIATAERPTVDITNDAAGAIANIADGALTFTFAWSEEVMGFETDDITVTDGTADVVVSLMEVTTGLAYTLTVTPTADTNDGTITVTVAVDAVTAIIGTNRTNPVATVTQAYDNVAPAFAPDADTDTATTFTADAPITTEVYDANATDGGNDADITYSLSGSANDELFTIDSDDGFVTYIASPTMATSHTFTVTATDKGGNTDTIEVTVPVGASANAMLSALSVTPSGGLTPDFVPGVLAYTANAPAFTTFVTVVADASDNDATIGITGTAADGNTALTVPGTSTGIVSGAVSGLTDGNNVLAVTVNAENTSTMLTYTLTLTVPERITFMRDMAMEIPLSDGTTVVNVMVPVDGGVVAIPLPTPPAAPAGVEFGVTVDIAFDNVDGLAADDDPATVCLPTTGVPDGLEPVLYHYNDTSEVWDDIGRNTATRAGFVCGTTRTFSPFGVGWTTSASDRLNEQILTLAAQSAVADTLAAVGARVESMVGGATASVSATPQYLLGGQSSMRGLLEAHGQSMLEGEMEYARLLDGASFVAPLRAADDEEGGAGVGPITMWGSTNYRALDVDDDDFDWDGGVSNTNFGVDAQVGESILAGVALSWSRGKFDYDGTGDAGSGEYEYNAANISPYFGWSPRDGLSLWALAGVGDGEIEVDTQDGANNSTDTSQYSLAAGMKSEIMNSSTRARGSIALSMKGDVAAVRVAVDKSQDGAFAEQEVGGERARLLLAGEYTRSLSGGGSMTPSLEIGGRYDDGDGNTGTGLELGAGMRYTNSANTLAVESGIRTLNSFDYNEFGADLLVLLSPPTGRGLSLRVNPVWGKTQSAAERLWDDGVNALSGGDTELRSRMDSEVGYGLAATMLGSAGVLTPYTGMTVGDGETSRLRLGGRFAGGNGLSLNLESARENTADGANHTVLLRGELAF